jgi:hypothetical protein
MLPAANGTVIDYTPLSNFQLINMVNDLLITTKADKKHLAEVFAVVNGLSVKDHDQIFHPSTQLRLTGEKRLGMTRRTRSRPSSRTGM